jgi:hypothetical protein
VTGREKKLGGTILVLLLLAGVGVLKYSTAAKDGEPCRRANDCRRIWGAVCVIRDSSNFCSKLCDGPSDCWDGWTCTNALAHKRRTTRERQVCVPN